MSQLLERRTSESSCPSTAESPALGLAAGDLEDPVSLFVSLVSGISLCDLNLESNEKLLADLLVLSK